MDPSVLEVGRTYFQLTFADSHQTMPSVEPIVFIGPVELNVGGHAFAFQDTISFVRFGSRLELNADNDEVLVYFLTEEDVGSLEDVHGISRAVAEAALRAQSLGHPVLPVMREGLERAS